MKMHYYLNKTITDKQQQQQRQHLFKAQRLPGHKTGGVNKEPCSQKREFLHLFDT